MKRIQFKKLEITDFQGIANLSIDFNEGITSIEGRNGVGKSTVLDAILWCLTGKNGKDQADTKFKIIPLNSNNEENTEAKTRVRLTITDGTKEHILTRKLKLKFTRDEEGKVDRNIAVSKTTEFSIGDIKLKKSQYNDKINELLGSIDGLKLLSNPNHFLANLGEKEQRSLLLQYIKPVEHELMCQLDERYKSLTELEELPFEQVLISIRKSYTDTEKTIEEKQSEKKGMSVSLASIDTGDTSNDDLIKERDDKKQKIIDMRKSNQDYIANQSSLLTKRNQLALKELEVSNAEGDFARDKSIAIANKQSDINIANMTLNSSSVKLNTSRADYLKLKTEKENVAARAKESVEASITSFEATKEREVKVEKQIADGKIFDIQNEIKKIDVNAIDATCSMCKQDLPQNEIESQKAHKQAEIDKLNDKIVQIGTSFKSAEDKVAQAIVDLKLRTAEEITKRIASESSSVNFKINTNITNGKAEKVKNSGFQFDVGKLEKEMETLKAMEFNPDSIAELQKEVEALKIEVDSFANSAVQYKEEDIKLYEDRVEQLSSSLSSVDNVSKIKENIANAAAEIDLKTTALSQLEYKKMLLEDYLKTKNNILSESLKPFFNEDITFKFIIFTQDGTPKDVFKLLVNGVDYINVNTAGKIIAGIQMINFFQTQKGISLPVLIDNRENVVNEFDFKGQIIQARAVADLQLNIK